MRDKVVGETQTTSGEKSRTKRKRGKRAVAMIADDRGDDGGILSDTMILVTRETM